MPGPVIARPTLPEWTQPENASVFDPPYRAPIRTLIQVLGLDDPEQLVAAFGTPMEIPGAMAGGAFAMLAQRFPRFAQAVAQMKGMPKPLGTLAKTLEKTEAPAVYQLKPSVQGRLAHFYELGGQQPTLANWAGVTDELTAAFGGNRTLALTWARLWGATSPNTSVPRNTQESIAVWLHFLKERRFPLTVQEAQTLTPAPITMAPSKVPNINRAILGEPLSGDKVEAMSRFMVGDPRIPIDVHALYGLGAKSDKFGPELSPLRAFMTRAEKLPARGGLTDTQIYERYERAIRDTLEVFNPDLDLNSIFARMWEGVRAGKGLAPQGGPIDILRTKGLLEPGAMMDPDRLTSVLKTAGWTAPAIAALLTSIDQFGLVPPASAPEGDGHVPYGPAAPPNTLPSPSRPR